MPQLAEVIDHIYEVATTPEGFYVTAQQIAELIRGESCAIVVQNYVTYGVDGAWYWGVSEKSVHDYQSTYFQFDPTVVEHIARGRETAYASDFHCQSDIYKTNRFLNEQCKPLNLGYFAGIYTPLTNNLMLRLTVQGATERGQFSTDDLAVLDALMPHLRRGMEIHRKFMALRSQHTVISAALEAAGSAMILLDSDSNVVSSNSAAMALLGNGISQSDHRLKILDPTSRKQFEKALQNAFLALSGAMEQGRGAGSHSSIPRRGLPDLSCYIAPVRMPAGEDGDWNQPFPRDLVAVQLFDPRQEAALAPELLQHVLGLTAAEARVAAALCTGLDAGEMAAKLSLSPHTIRDHIKHIYAKMGVSKQSECVARAFAVLAPHMHQTQKG